MCPHCKAQPTEIVKFGFFPRKNGFKRRIQRYICKLCSQSFSDQTGTLTYRERKSHLTQQVMRLTMEGLSMRGCARTLGCKTETVAKKLQRLGKRARMHLEADTDPEFCDKTIEKTVVFDEMETFEHSKCKPVSIALAVEERSRRVVAIAVASMPAKGKLAAISRKKYGKRADHRPHSLRKMLQMVKTKHPHIQMLKSDECPRYPKYVQEIFGTSVSHQTYKGRRGCVVGQGELKVGGFDPLFSLNHTCAMFRDHLKRLARRTWCTTKVVERLADHVNLYAWWHNQRLVQPRGVIQMT